MIRVAVDDDGIDDDAGNVEVENDEGKITGAAVAADDDGNGSGDDAVDGNNGKEDNKSWLIRMMAMLLMLMKMGW
jgi:hypothetical protein